MRHSGTSASSQWRPSEPTSTNTFEPSSTSAAVMRQRHARRPGCGWPDRWVSTALAVLAVVHVCAAGPPYLYVDGESVLFKNALFGPAATITGCRSVKANPRYAETATLQNAAAIAGNIAVIDRDPPEKPADSRLSFVEKAQRAEAAGAVMVVMVNTKEEMLRCVDCHFHLLSVLSDWRAQILSRWIVPQSRG